MAQSQALGAAHLARMKQPCSVFISKSEKPQPAKSPNSPDRQMQAIAYSLDALIPGFYFWLGTFKIRLGGSQSEENYPGVIHSSIGIALVLPGYRIYTTYQGSYNVLP